ARLMAVLRDGSAPPMRRMCLVGALDGAGHGPATPKPDTAPGRDVNLNLASSIMRYSEQSRMVTAAPWADVRTLSTCFASNAGPFSNAAARFAGPPRRALDHVPYRKMIP